MYQVIFDDIGPSHFIWQPYTEEVLDSLPVYCLRGREIWRYCGPLICIFIVEPHQPNRVLKQFGMLQTIPDHPQDSSELHKLTLQGKVYINWVQKHQPSINLWNSHLNCICKSDMIVGVSEVPEYYRLVYAEDAEISFLDGCTSCICCKYIYELLFSRFLLVVCIIFLCYICI